MTSRGLGDSDARPGVAEENQPITSALASLK